jgi:hypothetical protein
MVVAWRETPRALVAVSRRRALRATSAMMAQNGGASNRRACRPTAADPAMPIPPIVPRGEALRRAVAWLAEHGTWSAQRVEEACQRFDLGPLDEEFLLRELERRHSSAGPAK